MQLTQSPVHRVALSLLQQHCHDMSAFVHARGVRANGAPQRGAPRTGISALKSSMRYMFTIFFLTFRLWREWRQ